MSFNTHLSPRGSPSQFDQMNVRASSVSSVSTPSSSSSSDSSDEEDDLQVLIRKAERERLELEEREKHEKKERERLERERLEKEKEERRNAKKEKKRLAKKEAKRLAKKEEKKRSETATNTTTTGRIEDEHPNEDTNLKNKRKREQSAQASAVPDSHTKSPPSKRKYVLPAPNTGVQLPSTVRSASRSTTTPEMNSNAPVHDMGKQLKPLPKNAHKLTIVSEDEDEEEGEDSDIEVISTTSHRNRSSLSIKKERKISETQLDEKGCYILSLQERDEMQKTIRGMEQGANKILDYCARQSALLGSTSGVIRGRPVRNPEAQYDEFEVRCRAKGKKDNEYVRRMIGKSLLIIYIII
jgi:hypothetical protein